MSGIRHIADISTRKVLAAAAALAAMTALVSNFGLCFIWLNQPKMPESVRQMGRFKD
jgi:cyclic lactone autoinducer peptide